MSQYALTESAREVVRLGDAWASAELRGDAVFLECTLVNDFLSPIAEA